MMMPYIFQRGETITLALDAVTGDPALVTDVAAVLKRLPAGQLTVPVGTAVAAAFDVVDRAADGSTPAGWTLTIDAATSAALAAGGYQADARLTMAGGVIVTEAVSLRIRESVTP